MNRIDAREFGEQDSLASYLKSGIPLAEPELCIAHLSDLHFVTHSKLKHVTFRGMVGHDVNALEAIETQLTTMEVDLLFVTGDLSTWGDETSLQDARGFIMTLAVKLRLQPYQVFWIPGNHDVIVDYHKIATKERKFTKVCGTTEPLKQLSVKGMDVAVFSFDSTFREGFWPFTSNRGEVTQEAFNSFNRSIQQVNTTTPHAIKLVQIHHHPYPIPYKKDNGVAGVLTTMTNGATFVDRMQEKGMNLILHGHEHYAYSTSLQPYPQERPTVLIAAGTACQVHNHEMSFNYLRVRRNKEISLTRYVYRETGFYMDRNSTKIFLA
jgi:3',5'-cyclic AMP phosphodiesterase CpdA